MPRSQGIGGISPWLTACLDARALGGWALFHWLLVPKTKTLLFLLGLTSFWLCLIMVLCWLVLWIILLRCMSSWCWGVAGPVGFGVGGAGNVLGPSGCTLAPRGAPWALRSPTLWWDHNIVPCPNNCMNTCNIFVLCPTGVAHSPCQCTLLQNCQCRGRRWWGGNCASIVLVLFCFGSSHGVLISPWVGLGQLCPLVEACTRPFVSCSKRIHRELQFH